MSLINQLQLGITERDIIQIFLNNLILMMFTDFMKRKSNQGGNIEETLQNILRQWRSGMNNRANEVALGFINEIQGSRIGEILSKQGFDGETLRLQTKKQLDEAEEKIKEILDVISKVVKES